MSVRVYDNALIPEVIGTIYQAGKPSSTWCWALWWFPEPCGSSAGSGYRIPAKLMDFLLEQADAAG